MNPRVFITLPSGRVLRRSPKKRVLPLERFCVHLPRAEAGQYQIEIMLEGPWGPEVATLFPLFVGLAPPEHPVQKLYPPIAKEREVIERRLLQLINTSRRHVGAPPLVLSPDLVLFAREHSQDMRQNGYFGHHSPRIGTLAERLAAAHLKQYSDVTENLALCTDPQKAHDSLMNSPSHRRNMLNPRLTHVGVGVTLDSSKELLYITQSFARVSDLGEEE
jgi:uncharacterized protein YkwD